MQYPTIPHIKGLKITSLIVEAINKIIDDNVKSGKNKTSIHATNDGSQYIAATENKMTLCFPQYQECAETKTLFAKFMSENSLLTKAFKQITTLLAPPPISVNLTFQFKAPNLLEITGIPKLDSPEILVFLEAFAPHNQNIRTFIDSAKIPTNPQPAPASAPAPTKQAASDPIGAQITALREECTKLNQQYVAKVNSALKLNQLAEAIPLCAQHTQKLADLLQLATQNAPTPQEQINLRSFNTMLGQAKSRLECWNKYLAAYKILNPASESLEQVKPATKLEAKRKMVTELSFLCTAEEPFDPNCATKLNEVITALNKQIKKTEESFKSSSTAAPAQVSAAPQPVRVTTPAAPVNQNVVKSAAPQPKPISVAHPAPTNSTVVGNGIPLQSIAQTKAAPAINNTSVAATSVAATATAPAKDPVIKEALKQVKNILRGRLGHTRVKYPSIPGLEELKKDARQYIDSKDTDAITLEIKKILHIELTIIPGICQKNSLEDILHDLRSYLDQEKNQPILSTQTGWAGWMLGMFHTPPFLEFLQECIKVVEQAINRQQPQPK